MCHFWVVYLLRQGNLGKSSGRSGTLTDMLGKSSGHREAVCLGFAARMGMRADRTSGHTGRIQLPGWKTHRYIVAGLETVTQDGPTCDGIMQTFTRFWAARQSPDISPYSASQTQVCDTNRLNEGSMPQPSCALHWLHICLWVVERGTVV